MPSEATLRRIFEPEQASASNPAQTSSMMPQAHEAPSALASTPQAHRRVPAALPLPRSVARWLFARYHVHRGPDGRLYVFSRAAGHYVTDLSVLLRAIDAEVGDRYTAAFARAVLDILRDLAPLFEQDRTTRYLSLANGILDREDRQLRPHSPELHTTIGLPIRFNPYASAELFERTLGQLLPSDLHAHIQELMGYLLVPDTSMQSAWMFVGAGGNGKSVLMHVFTALLGHWRNCSFLPLHTIADDRFALASMEGKLANIAADIESYELRRSGVLKTIIAGEPLEVQRKYSDLHPTVLSARLVFSCNTLPATSDVSHGFFRRWNIVPFERTFGAATADKQLPQKLTTPESRSGILNIALDGSDRLYDRGSFSSAEAIESAGKRYRVDADSTAAFVDERIELSVDHRVMGSALYAAFQTFCAQTGRKAVARKSFYERLRRLPVLDGVLTERKRNNSTEFGGIGIKIGRGE